MRKKHFTKLKHWLIKKLGGYVNEPIKPTYQYFGSDIVTLSTTVKADARDWYGRRSHEEGVDYKTRVMRTLKSKIGCDIAEHFEDLAIVNVCDNIEEDTVTVMATVRIVESGRVRGM